MSISVFINLVLGLLLLIALTFIVFLTVDFKNNLLYKSNCKINNSSISNSVNPSNISTPTTSTNPATSNQVTPILPTNNNKYTIYKDLDYEDLSSSIGVFKTNNTLECLNVCDMISTCKVAEFTYYPTGGSFCSLMSKIPTTVPTTFSGITGYIRQ